METRYIFILMRKWFWLIILACLLGGIGGLLVSLLQPKLYEAQATIYLVSPFRSDYNAVLGAQEAAKSFAFLPTSTPVLQATLRELGDNRLDISQLSSMVTVQNNLNSQYIVILVRSSDPKLTATLALEIAKQSIAQFDAAATDSDQTKQFVSQEIKRVQIDILNLENVLNNLRAVAGVTPSPSQRDTLNATNDKLTSERTLYNQLLSSYASVDGFQAVILQHGQILVNPVASRWLEAVAIGVLVGLIVVVAVILFIEQTRGILQPSTKVDQEVPNTPSTPITINDLLDRPMQPLTSMNDRDRQTKPKGQEQFQNPMP